MGVNEMTMSRLLYKWSHERRGYNVNINMEGKQDPEDKVSLRTLKINQLNLNPSITAKKL